MSVHRVEGIGNITRTPELRYLASGTAVITVSVAVNDSFQREGETVERTTYWNCEFYGDQAERVAQRDYQKGDRVFFEGRPEISTYENREGETRTRCKVRFPNVFKVGGKSTQGEYRAATEPEKTESAKSDDDDVAF